MVEGHAKLTGVLYPYYYIKIAYNLAKIFGVTITGYKIKSGIILSDVKIYISGNKSDVMSFIYEWREG